MAHIRNRIRSATFFIAIFTSAAASAQTAGVALVIPQELPMLEQSSQQAPAVMTVGPMRIR